jgi:hypothetical protein
LKRAVSISIGSSKRDKSVIIELLGQSICLERIGTDGDMEKAARLFQELDGQVDAFGMGGADLGLMVAERYYPLYSVLSIVRYINKTPIVDGNGLKTTLESSVADYLNQNIGTYLDAHGRNTFLTAAVDRWGMAHAFAQAQFPCLYGDMLFTLGLPIPLYREAQVRTLAAVLMPVAGRIPFKWVYPVGKDQDRRTPKWGKYFDQANIIAGDCHYITRYMPDQMKGKVVVTNTTTPEDVDQFQRAGVKYLVTTTPVLEGRSFGTNVMEAGLLALSGRLQPVDYRHPEAYLAQLRKLIRQLEMTPHLQELN